MPAETVTLRVGAYTVIGTDGGYEVQRDGAGLEPSSARHTHRTLHDSRGRLIDTGLFAPRTNAQRGVMWLKNHNLVGEGARVEEVKG